MNWDRVEGNWKQIKVKAQQKWGNIANDSLDVIGGYAHRAVGPVAGALGHRQGEAERQFDA